MLHHPLLFRENPNAVYKYQHPMWIGATPKQEAAYLEYSRQRHLAVECEEAKRLMQAE